MTTLSGVGGSTAMYTPSQYLALLAVIDRLIADGTRHVAKMRDLIAEGERQQFDMTEAKGRLEQFLAAQAFRQAEREQVLKELNRTSRSPHIQAES